MNALDFQPNTSLAAVYFNNGTPNLVRIRNDVTLSDLKRQLNSLLHFREQRWVTEIVYRHPSVCTDGTMFSIFTRYMTKGPIELDATLVRSVEVILSNMIPLRRPRTFDEIAALMVKPGEDEEAEVEPVNLSYV
ncbi:hypothetical protein L195_g044905 [Trifolium pratense]|uniref:Uncharacterized protein n=1 Tax=Trifolium pratense TaxID=57577 RepID=A0A2K3MDC4_TRIPR|nr:hypothetical protein L195_g044905 [Trifolium pratense]